MVQRLRIGSLEAMVRGSRGCRSVIWRWSGGYGEVVWRLWRFCQEVVERWSVGCCEVA